MTLPGQVMHEEQFQDPSVVSCPFQFAGCAYQSKQVVETQKHIKEAPNKHLTYLCDAVQDLLSEARLLTVTFENNEVKLDNIGVVNTRLQHSAGSHLLWKIDSYQQKFMEAKTGAKATIFSPSFLVGRHGYKLVVIAALYGDGKARGQFMSVFVSIARGEFDAVLAWPFHHHVKITLLDQCANPTLRKNVMFTIKPNIRVENRCFFGRPAQDRNASVGAQNFIELTALENFTFVKDDTIFLQVDVDMTDMNLL